jgi:hypothetical protein
LLILLRITDGPVHAVECRHIAVNRMVDWKEGTGDGTLLRLVREGREKGEQGSKSPSRNRWNIKESMLVNYERVCVDRSYSWKYCEG